MRCAIPPEWATRRDRLGESATQCIVHRQTEQLGARPTDDISIEFEIKWKSAMLLFITYSTITTKFCTRHCVVRKISLWLVKHIFNQSTANFDWISNSIEIPLAGRGPGLSGTRLIKGNGDIILPGCSSISHWGRDKMDVMSQTTISNALSWMKMLGLRLKFHWSLFLRVELTIFHHWFK